MDTVEKSQATDTLNAGMVMNSQLNEEIKAPRMHLKFECLGPKEDQRADYIKVQNDYLNARKAGLTVLAQEHLEKLMSFELENKWTEEIHNLVTTAGKTDILDKYLKGSSYTAAWYMGLKGTGTISASDTLASHAGWSEVTPYSGNRPAITWGTTTTGSNTATAVSYSITGSATVAGAFCCTVNSGTSGVLYNVSDFGSSRSVVSGDTLNVTPTLTIS